MEKRVIKTQEEARQYAIDWQNWVGKQNLSYGEIANEKDTIEEIGRTFGLLEEFKENGIL